ncbi:hypothetical protein ABK040_007934 [Willaertia magna]
MNNNNNNSINSVELPYVGQQQDFSVNFTEPFLESEIHSKKNNKRYKKNSICNCTKRKCCFITLITIISLILLFASLILAAFFIAGNYAYDTVFRSDRKHSSCPKFYSQSNPVTGFTTTYEPCKQFSNVNFNEWNLPASTPIETVHFNSRDLTGGNRGGSGNKALNITATLILQNNVTMEEKSKFVVLIHGIRSCRRKYEVLAPAMMLWWAGYNSLLIDLRNCGDSEVDSKNPIATFGYKEHLDVLGAVDYLTERFPYLNKTNNLHIFGASMGGATALITFTLEPRFKSLFVDSAACNVIDTVYHNVQTVVSKNFAPFIWGGMQAMALTKSDYGFVPFPLDPLNLVSTRDLRNRPMFFEQTEGDTMVPKFNFEQCVAAAKNSGALVDTYFIDIMPQGQKLEDGCNSHVATILYDKKAYSQRLIGFYNKHSGI